MSKGKKIGIAVAAVFVVVIAVSAITYQIAPPASSATDAQQTVADEYTKTDASQSYVRDGEECMGVPRCRFGHSNRRTALERVRGSSRGRRIPDAHRLVLQQRR